MNIESEEYCGPHRLTHAVRQLNDALGSGFRMPMPARSVGEQYTINALKNSMIQQLGIEFPFYRTHGGNLASIPTEGLLKRAALELRWDLLTQIEQDEGGWSE